LTPASKSIETGAQVEFIFALILVILLISIGACYILSGFVARRWPRLLAALGVALLAISYSCVNSGIHYYHLSNSVHGAEGWAPLGPLLQGTVLVFAGVLLFVCAVTMLVRALNPPAQREKQDVDEGTM
jgi:hypothetical protein